MAGDNGALSGGEDEAALAAAMAEGFDKQPEPEPVKTAETAPAAPAAATEQEPAPAATEQQPKPEPAAAEQEPLKPVEQPPKPEAKPAAAKKPEYVRLTKEEHESLKAAAAKVAEFGPKIDKLFGTQGELKQRVEKWQAETPKGQAVELDAAALAELKRDFPELAGQFERLLAPVLKGLKGTGAAEAAKPDGKPAAAATAPSSDPEAALKQFREETFKSELEELEFQYSDWQTIVGRSDTPDDKNPFRVWLKAQPAEYQKKINDTLSPADIRRAIARFQAATARPQATQQTEKTAKTAEKTPARPARANLVANAVPPRTAGGQPPARTRTAEDEFRDGFNSG